MKIKLHNIHDDLASAIDIIEELHTKSPIQIGYELNKLECALIDILVRISAMSNDFTGNWIEFKDGRKVFVTHEVATIMDIISDSESDLQKEGFRIHTTERQKNPFK